jgi:RNA polymerase sigma factor (sigma-70 family)
MMNMAVQRIGRAIQDFRKRAFPDDLSDGELLSSFIDDQEGFAFAALVRRHGPMVWGVCRRIVGHHQDAEDAFQATFLVLARKAASVRPRPMVANWLFGVAHRTALKAKAMAGKRHARETQMTTPPEPQSVPQDSWENLEHLIDREMASLPDKYRIAIVLCDLEGKKGKDAARQLKIPEGTLASRLRTGRVLLAKRLIRQGVTLSGGALATVLARHATAASVPTVLVSSTIDAATLTAAGKTLATGMITAKAVSLMEGVMKTMLLTKLKPISTVALVVGLVAFGGGLGTRHAVVGPQVQGAEHETPANQQVIPHAKADDDPASARVKTRNAVLKKAPLPADKGEVISAYAVADLVVPIPGLDVPGNENNDGKTKERWLIRKVTQNVSPASWNGSGGTGHIEYFPLSHTLVVNNTARVQAQVRYLLATMRRVQDVQVVAEARIVSLNAACFVKLRGLVPQLVPDDHAVLNDAEAFALLRKAQDDAATKVVLTPKITFFPGQRARVSLDPGKDLPGIKKADVQLSAMVAANLQHLELDLKATIGKAEFAKRIWSEEGVTLAQVKRNGDDYLILLVKPRVILVPEEVESRRVTPPTADKMQEPRADN